MLVTPRSRWTVVLKLSPYEADAIKATAGKSPKNQSCHVLCESLGSVLSEAIADAMPERESDERQTT